MQSVEVEFAITLAGTMGAVSKQPGVAHITLTLTLQGWLYSGVFVCSPPQNPPGSGSILSAPTSGNEFVDLPGMGSVGPLPVNDSNSDSLLLTSALDDLAAYTGDGMVDFTACFRAGIGVDGIESGDVDLSFTTNALAELTVTYTFISTGIEIEKSTNGDDADEMRGPLIPVGALVSWEYVVTNTGEATIEDMVVTDSDPGVIVVCTMDTLAGGLLPPAFMTCTAAGVATIDQYSNVGEVEGKPVDGDTPLGLPIDDDDPSHYFGYFADVSIEKSTNGFDADGPAGPSILVGQPVNWLYEITNVGNVPLIEIDVTDDQLGAVSCPFTTLLPGISMDCTAMGVAVEGPYANLGTVLAKPTDFIGQPLPGTVTDNDPSHYNGVVDCIPKKPKPKSHPKGTKYVKYKKIIYIVVWKPKRRYVKVGGHRYGVKMRKGRPYVRLGGKNFGVKTLKRTRKLALGNTPLPPCPKDDKKSAPKKNDKSKDPKGKGGGGYQSPPHVPPKGSDTGVGKALEPVTASGSQDVTCVGSKRYWLKGAGRHHGAWREIVPNGKKTRFFANTMVYVKVLRKGSDRPYFQLARGYITAKLNMYYGAPTTRAMERSMAFAERHFAGHRAGYTSIKRALKAQTANGSKGHVKNIKKLRKKMLRHAAKLHHYGGMPSCSI